MQRRKGPLVLISLTALALTFTALPARSQDDPLKERAAAIVRRADEAQFGEVWGLSRELIELEGKDEALAKAIQQVGEGAGEKGRLVSAKALLELTDQGVFADQVLGILKPVLDAKDPEVRAAAASLLGDQSFVNRPARKEIRSLLMQRVTADTEAPKVRIEAAKALFQTGTPEDRTTARAELRNFLKSSDRGLRTQGALALAAIDDMPDARAELDKIALEPTVEGELARSFLRRERMTREFEQQLNRLAARKFGEETQKERSGKFAMLAEILGKVQAGHIRGDKFSEEELLNAAAGGLLHYLDRHSSFLTSEEYARFYFDLNREYGGIGAFVNFDQDDIFSIVRPIYSGPAYRAGLKSGDKLLEVDGWETSGHSSDEIIAKLKGQPGTKVTIKFRRLGLPEAKEVTLTREEIQVPSVNFDMLPGKVGYLECLTFGQNTADEMRHAIDHLQEQGAKALVLDLRNNTGGYLLAARDVVELFVPGAKLVVYTEGRSTQREEYKTRNQAVVPEMPLVVLVNEFSASASEITAGALQDHKRATIVGKRSFGKGSVQSLIELKTARGEVFDDKNGNGTRDEWEPYTDANKNGKYDVGPRLKLTVARYYLPSGRCLHKDIDEATGKVVNPDWGIVPDREVELREFSTKELWKNAEVFELLQKDVFRKYARAHLDQNKELFLQLADGDRGDFTKYPEFEQFYSSLDTKLSKDDVRRWLRWTLRDEVADARGKAYPGGRALGDYQEDGQLQEAMKALFEKLGQDIKQLPEFQGGVLKVAQDKKPEEAKKKG